MIRNPFRFYQVPAPPPTYFGGTLPAVNVRSTYPDDYVANAVRQGGSRFFGTAGRFMGQPQRDMMEFFTGLEQTPSEYFGIESPVGAFVTDAVTDPVNLIGGSALARLARIGTTRASLRNALKLKPTSVYTQPLASNNVDLRRFSNPRSIWDQLFNIKRPEQSLLTPLNAEDELARANADALAFSQSPYNRAKLQRFRQGQDFDVTNTEALFSNDPLARERFDKLMKDDPNFLNYKNIENWQGAAEGNYGAKNFGDMDDLATVNKGIPQSKIYDAAIHEMGHSRSVRLPATVEERAILDDAWKPLQEPNGSPVPFLEAEAVQGELRMMLGDKLGKRVYTQKDAGEIKKALEKMVANDHPYVHIRNINDFDIPKIIKSLNEIGLAGFAGGVVAPKLLKNDKKGKK